MTTDQNQLNISELCFSKLELAFSYMCLFELCLKVWCGDNGACLCESLLGLYCQSDVAVNINWSRRTVLLMTC